MRGKIIHSPLLSYWQALLSTPGSPKTQLQFHKTWNSVPWWISSAFSQNACWRKFKIWCTGQSFLYTSFINMIFIFSSGNPAFCVFPRVSYHHILQSTKLIQARSCLWNQRHTMLRPTLNAAWVSDPNFWSAICSLFPCLPGSWPRWHFSLVLCRALVIEQQNFQIREQCFRTDGILCKVIYFSRCFKDLGICYHNWSFFKFVYVTKLWIF